MTHVTLLIRFSSLTGITLAASIVSVWANASMNMFVTSKEIGRSESLMTHTACTSFLITWSFELAGTVSYLIPWILCFRIIYWLHSYNLTCISQHPRTHIIPVSWQQITQLIVLSLITNMFTFIYIIDQRARQSSPLILPLSTFMTDGSRLICRNLAPNEGKKCIPYWEAWCLFLFNCCLVYKDRK